MELTPLQATKRPYSLMSSDALLGPQNPQDVMGTKGVAAKRQRTMYGPRAATEDLQILFEYPYESGAFWSPIPRFTTYNIRLGSAKVFQVVGQGNLEELLRMLWAGEASLRDQDPLGRTLLFYGNREPAIVRFLLDHGADVDHVARAIGFEDSVWPRTTALNPCRNYFETEKEELKPLIECLKMLLLAGGDPTWDDPDYDPVMQLDKPVLANIFMNGVVEVMEVAFECSDGLLTSATVVDSYFQRTALLSYCSGGCCNPRYSVDALSLLVSRGANLNDRDSAGNTCLHLIMDGIRSGSSFCHLLDESMDATDYLEEVRAAAVYLIDQGADVWAENNQGVSISKMSYCMNGVREYLWDLILADSGYEIAMMRKDCGYIGRWRRYHAEESRSGRSLGEQFTLDVFKALWWGDERLCPYYEKVLHFGLAERKDDEDDEEDDEEEHDEDVDDAQEDDLDSDSDYPDDSNDDDDDHHTHRHHRWQCSGSTVSTGCTI
ncbi:hypothetical protein QBC37DRAFT_458128 [Rhypophila decipiens]|uniref:Ankyrin n=1 Tax=Rhypophila decipiens TaxID=261697 RepID=A0AAN6XTZ0_9PEZI|nr:hypothetical protein QBC37DRAFT_458128 [Rhypophila decipiens]